MMILAICLFLDGEAMKQLHLVEENTLEQSMRELAQRFADGPYTAGQWYENASHWVAVDYAPSPFVDAVFNNERPDRHSLAGVGLPFYPVVQGLRADGADGCIDYFVVNGRRVAVAVVALDLPN